MKIFRTFLIFFILSLFICFHPVANAQQPILSSQQTHEQAYKLYTELRCPVCQGQSLADSPAELAADMRALILERLQSGETPEAIIAFLKVRYGDAISFNPPFTERTYFLWFFPPGLLLMGLLVVGWRLRQAHRDKQGDRTW